MNKDIELEIRCVYAWSYEIGRKDKKKSLILCIGNNLTLVQGPPDSTDKGRFLQ